MTRRCIFTVAIFSLFSTNSFLHADRPDVVWQVGGHVFRIHSLSFSADGSRAISAAEDGTLKVWDVATGALMLTATVPAENFSSPSAMSHADFSPEGDTIWAASVGGLYQYRASDGEFLQSLIAMESAGQVFFSPDGQYLGMAGSPAGVEDATYIYRRSDGALIHAFEPAGSVAAVFTANSQYVIAGTTFGFESDPGIIRYYRMSDGGLERTIAAHTDSVTWISLSPDGTMFASSSKDGTAKLWNAADGSLLHTLTGHSDTVDRVKFSPDGSRVATSSYDGTIRTWNAQTGAALDTFTPMDGLGVGAFAWAPNGQTLLTATGAKFGQPTPRIREIAAADGTFLREFTGIFGQFTDMALSPDGTRIVYSEYPTRLSMFDAADGSLMWSSGAGFFQDYVAFSADSSTLAVGRNNGAVDFLDVSNGSTINSFVAHGDRVVDIAFSPDGSKLATRCRDATVKIWSYPALTLQAPLSIPFISSAGLVFTPAGNTIAIAVGNATSLFDTNDGSFIRSYIGHEFGTQSVDIAQDNHMLLTGSIDRTARIWDLDTGAELRALEPHDGWVRTAALSPDERIAATGTVYTDRSLRLWDVATGELLVRYTVDTGSGPHGIRFSPDGRTIYYGRADGTLVAIRNPFAFAAGDVNADGIVDVDDATALAAALVGQPLGTGDALRSDVNRDGHADGADISAWIPLYLNP